MHSTLSPVVEYATLPCFFKSFSSKMRHTWLIEVQVEGWRVIKRTPFYPKNNQK